MRAGGDRARPSGCTVTVTALTAEATAEQLELAVRYVGSYPCVENVATPVDPPGSDCSGSDVAAKVLDASPANLLLDLHNLYTNGG